MQRINKRFSYIVLIFSKEYFIDDRLLKTHFKIFQFNLIFFINVNIRTVVSSNRKLYIRFRLGFDFQTEPNSGCSVQFVG